MKLPAAPTDYDKGDQAAMRGAVERADSLNLKTHVAYEFFLIKRPDGTVRKLTISNSDVVTVSPYP